MGTNGLTKYEGAVAPAPIAGWSALTLVQRGTIIELSGAAMVIPVAITAVGHHDVWTGLFFSILVVAVGVGGALSIRGDRKAVRESQQGYVTIPQHALRLQSLYLLHRLDYHVMLYPGQVRPRSMRHKDLVAWRARYDYPEDAGS